MLRRITLVIVVLAVLLAFAVGTAFGTASSGVTAETARGTLVDRPLDVNWHFGPGSKIKLQSSGPMEVAYQRIVATPGSTFGWHSHPGPTIVTILSGTMSFYHGRAVLLEHAGRDPSRPERGHRRPGGVCVVLPAADDPTDAASHRPAVAGYRVPPVG